jgi:hypothetical protein
MIESLLLSRKKRRRKYFTPRIIWIFLASPFRTQQKDKTYQI